MGMPGANGPACCRLAPEGWTRRRRSSKLTNGEGRVGMAAQTGTNKAAQREPGAQDPMKDDTEAPPPPGDDPLRRFSALSGDWFWVQDAQLRLTYLSSRLEAGVDVALYLGARRWDQPALNLTQTDWDLHRAQVERHEAFKDFEIQCVTEDGRTLWLSLSAQPL